MEKNIENIVLRGVISIVEKQNGNIWVGTMTSLMSSLNRVLSQYQRTLLPSNPSTLRLVVNKVVNRLRNRGISVRFGRFNDHTRTRYVRFAH